jgi:acetyl-CoA carboxylase biotin carboxyl carrier protein
MDSKELLNLIRFVAKAGVSEVKYKTKDFEINIKTPLAGSEAPISFAPQPVAYQAPIAHL